MNETQLEILNLAATGDLHGVQQALRSGIPPQTCDDFGRTALHEAAAAGHDQILRVLLEAGANPNSACLDGWTPLCEAAKFSRSQTVLLLLNHGAKIGLPRPLSAYNAALRSNADAETFRALLAGMTPGPPDKEGKRIIDALIRKSRADVVSIFLQSGASAQINSEDECPLIRLALQHSSSETVRVLLDEFARKISPQALADVLSLACNRAGERPGNSSVDIIQQLLLAGANPHLPDSTGSTPLQYACLNGQFGLLDLLIGKGDMPKEVYGWVMEGAFMASHLSIHD